MKFFTGVFQGFYLDFKKADLSPPCLPMYHQLKLPTMFSTPMGNPENELTGCLNFVYVYHVFQLKCHVSNMLTGLIWYGVYSHKN